MLTDATIIAALILSAALVFGCPAAQPSPLVPVSECDPSDARHRAASTCAKWSEVLDSPPAYCTDAGTVVDGFDWCEEAIQ